MNSETVLIERNSAKGFLSSIAFHSAYYGMYVGILSGAMVGIVHGAFIFNERVFVMMVCQSAFQAEFDGTLDDFYVDVARRKKEYATIINANFKTACLSTDSQWIRLAKHLCCLPITPGEKLYYSNIPAINIEACIGAYFEEHNKARRNHFKTICHDLLLDITAKQVRHAASTSVIGIHCDG